jgi:hypothetical protein
MWLRCKGDHILRGDEYGRKTHPLSSGVRNRLGGSRQSSRTEENAMTFQHEPAIQVVFDKIVTGMLKQGCGSFSMNNSGESPSPMYRSVNGHKCAIGMLIPDEEYDSKKMESKNAVSIVGISPTYDATIQAIPNFFIDHNGVKWDLRNNFLYSMQACHDNAVEDSAKGKKKFIDIFKREARNLAVCFNLNTHALEEKPA